MNHQFSNDKFKDFNCKQCIFSCDREYDMTKHLDDHSLKTYCALCDIKVTSLDMPEHYRQCHLNQVHLKCCSKTFQSYFQLMNHMKMRNCGGCHTDKTYLCPICRKWFQNERQLVLIHFLSRYPCAKCKKCLSTKSEFKMHADHMNLQPIADIEFEEFEIKVIDGTYRCPIAGCLVTKQRKSTLKNHISKQHVSKSSQKD